MAKNMARIDEQGKIINIEWVDVNQDATDTLIEIDDYDVNIGDLYEKGRFYHDGKLLLSPFEMYQNQLAEIQLDTDTMLIDYEYRLTLLEPAVMALDNNVTTNSILYKALKRIKQHKELDIDLEVKLNIFFANGKISEEEYNELISQEDN